ncbi:MAG TPA: methionine synthase [Vicinamibacterales bacterium]|jgi:5-methyltetrahydrofolate--homocysteine methyltransferase
MPGFTPGHRFQPAYFGFTRAPFAERCFTFFEREVKGLLFGCRMCGNCLLQETAFICPMECPKGLRNGPCGGSTPECCYVDSTRPCIWHRIYERAERMGREDRLLEVLPPLDWSRVGRETWLEVLGKVRDRGYVEAAKNLVAGGDARKEFWDGLFREIRQPYWWQGDGEPHPALPHQPVSSLEEKLAAGQFVVTSEVAPPLSVAPDELARTLAILRDYIDAANFTDNPSATPRMSSLACSALSIQQGVEPVMQMAARDRSRMAIQAEVLGAAALGIRNILCLTGDHPKQGPAPHGRMDIWDLDSIQMLWMLRRMRDTKQYLDGRAIANPPRLFLGAAASPSASTPRAQAQRELKKAHAGAQFFQSNLVYDIEAFERYLEGLDRAGVLDRTPFLVGITPVRSARAAKMMMQVPGIKIPAAMVTRLERSSDPQEEGVQIALEIIERVRTLKGVRGVHIMAVGWELIVPRLVREAGIKQLPAAAAEVGQQALTIRTRSGSRADAAMRPPADYTDRGYLDALAERVAVFDGAMGTELQRQNLSAADFGGERYVGCNDYLVLRKPEAIESVHASYLEAGCDVIETCTFRSNRLTMAEYGLEDQAPEINRAAAALARRVADRYSVEGHRRFVCGVLGPTGKLPSSSDPELSRISFQELAEVFAQQAGSLMDGDCDLLLIETSQDILEVKAAVMGVQDAFARTGRKIPLQVQVTLDTNGRMLLGTDIAAVLATLERMPIDVIGINCSTGPEHMRAPLAYLGDHSSRPLSCLPNAGLPLNVDGRAVYPLQPEEFAHDLTDFVERFGLNVVGGCCGTTPEHIRALVGRLSRRKARPRTTLPLPLVSSGITAASLIQNPRPMLIGERLNAQGSKKMKELLLAEDYDGIAMLGREQIDGGAHTLDICVAMTERRDETYLMSQVVKKLSQTVEAPLVIDTTEAEVLEVALEAAPGRIIVNAVNMENGRQRLDAMLPLVRDYGAATIALTIDERGMARTADRKVEVARRLYDIATREYGLLPDALIFDALTFTLATGDPESANTAVETLEGLRRIKAELPGVFTSLGVSNVSYGFKPAARWVLNSVFLYHAVEAGLDMAIVNPKQVTPYPEIPTAQRELAEDLLFNRRSDATARFISFYEGAKSRQTAADPLAGKSPSERLHWRILHRQPEGCEVDIDAILATGVREATGIANLFAQPGYTYPNPDTSAVAVRTLNQVLLPAMREVGDKFGSGELILPFVLQSAETMKKAVSHLEKYLEKAEGVTKGRIVLATVYGDVHDIGKNLIKTILANNGYSVHDLGKQVPVSTIVDRAAELQADVIGLSALLVSTSRQMPLVVRELDRRGLSVPVMVGGAAINRDFGRDITAVDGDRTYGGGVFYCRDAFEGLETVDRLMDPTTRDAVLARERTAADERRKPAAKAAVIAGRSSIVARPEDVPQTPFWGSRTMQTMPIEEVFERLNESRLFRVSWGGSTQRGAGWKQLQKDFSARLERMKREAIEQRWLVPQAVYGYFPAQSDGNELVVFHPDDHSQVMTRLSFPRQREEEHLCLADFFLPLGSEKMDVAALQVVTVGAAATERFDSMDAQDAYSEAYFSHGLAVRTAEAATELLCDRIRQELGLAGHRGVRFAWGFGALPDVEEHRKVFLLLPAERELGMILTSAGQLIPEQSTATLVVHHPEARYFNT